MYWKQKQLGSCAYIVCYNGNRGPHYYVFPIGNKINDPVFLNATVIEFTKWLNGELKPSWAYSLTRQSDDLASNTDIEIHAMGPFFDTKSIPEQKTDQKSQLGRKKLIDNLFK